MPQNDKLGEEIRSTKTPVLSAALYKKMVLHRKMALEGEARAFKSEEPARAPKTNKILSSIPVN